LYALQYNMYKRKWWYFFCGPRIKKFGDEPSSFQFKDPLKCYNFVGLLKRFSDIKNKAHSRKNLFAITVLTNWHSKYICQLGHRWSRGANNYINKYTHTRLFNIFYTPLYEIRRNYSKDNARIISFRSE